MLFEIWTFWFLKYLTDARWLIIIFELQECYITGVLIFIENCCSKRFITEGITSP